MKDGGSALGMSLRDWFAGQIVAGAISHPDLKDISIMPDNEALASRIYKIADSFIREREKANAP